MKKVAIFAVMGLFLSATAFAQIIVLQDGKRMYFPEDSQVVISGKTPAKVLFNKSRMLISVPANQKVQVQKKNGVILVSGTDMKGVEVAGKTISSNGHAIVSVSPKTKEVTNLRGDTSISESEVVLASNSNKMNNKQPAAKNNTAINESTIFPEISEYVNEVVSQQSVQDVTDVSPYAPRP